MSSSRTKQAKNAGREWFAPAHAWECVYQIGEQESIEVSILCIYIYIYAAIWIVFTCVIRLVLTCLALSSR